MRAASVALLAVAGAALGIAAERQAYGWSDLGGWVPDLLAGWTLLGLAIALLALRRPLGAAALLLLAGSFWFAIDLAAAAPGVFAWAGERAAYLHRAPLFALALTVPSGRPKTRPAVYGVALAWGVGVAWWLWDRDGTALVLAAVFVLLAIDRLIGTRGRLARSAAVRGLAAAAVLGAAITADSVRSLVGAPQAAADSTTVGYAVAVAVAGIVLFAAALLEEPAAVAERAIAIERSGVRLRDALRDLLGDPGLELGFGPAGTTLSDDLGEPLPPPPAGAAVTTVEAGGEQVGVVLHDPSTLVDTPTRAAVAATVALAARRSRLRSELDRQTSAVEESRRRLLRAEEDERRRLAEQLQRGPGAELDRVERLVRDARLADGNDGELDAAIDRAAAELERARPELDAFVRGLGGLGAEPLVSALEGLAAGLPVETHLELQPVAVSAEVGATLWFVCAETLTNVVKHAGARSVRVALGVDDGVVRLTVEDDGRGGADPRGSGISGLADRVSALGGRLLVVSPPGGGTQVVAELPSGIDAG